MYPLLRWVTRDCARTRSRIHGRIFAWRDLISGAVSDVRRQIINIEHARWYLAARMGGISAAGGGASGGAT